MIIEAEKILWKQRNAGIACGRSVYIGIYAHGVSIRIFPFNKYVRETLNECNKKDDFTLSCLCLFAGLGSAGISCTAES